MPERKDWRRWWQVESAVATIGQRGLKLEEVWRGVL
jgi:hypothetical protein